MMRAMLFAAALGALPAWAQGDFALRGQWMVIGSNKPDYIGTVLIDAQRRATWDSPDDNGRPSRFLGYVRAADRSRVEIVLTDRAAVIRVDCIAESIDMLHCHTVFSDGARSPMFNLARVGLGPASLAPGK